MFEALLFRLRWQWWKRRQETSAGLRAYFRDRHAIDVGRHSYGCFDRWRMAGPMTIGRYCSIANSVRRMEANHPTVGITTHPLSYDPRYGVVPTDRLAKTHLVIEDDVWIGHNAVILPGCAQIGRGAIIGAGAIVTHDVPAYAIMLGVPAKQVGSRFAAETVAALEASQWWLHEPATLAKWEADLGLVSAVDVAALSGLSDRRSNG